MKSTKKGFTLVELLVVIAIIAILATVAVVGYTAFVKKANESAVAQELTQIKDAIIAEDITNPNFEIKDGKISVSGSPDPNHANVNEFVDNLVSAMGGARDYRTVVNGDTEFIFVNSDKMIKAIWNLSNGEITTEEYDGDSLARDLAVKTESLDGKKDGDALSTNVTIDNNSGIKATLPQGVLVDSNATELKLTVKEVDENGNLNLSASDVAYNFDIHIDGISAGNGTPIIVHLGVVLPKGLEITLYHTDTLMTAVNNLDELNAADEYYYNAQTGEVSICVTNFSVFSAVESQTDEWDGTSDTSWYNEIGTEFVLTTAEQFAGFRDLVDGGNTFAGKTVKLGVNIDLANKPFDPIGFGYYNAETNTRVFMGTFDGQNHTIYNLYQNCWELDPDKENYSTYTYSTAGAGLFASIKDATVKNLAISGAEIVFECVDMGIVVGYAQGVCHFENIVVTDSNIANYNRYTGGVVGEVSYGPYGTDVSQGYSHTFKNVTVDSSVKVSGLWGSFGCGMGGIIGGKWGDATVKMENVISAAEMDVYNDVVSAYQWYAFRGCGMLIGHTEEPYSDGRHSGNATASFLTCENVNVYYGDWVNYHYYEFENQDDATGQRYPWVRAEAGEYCDAFSNIRYGVPTHGGVKVSDLTEEELKDVATDYTPIVFDQLYGADRGMYGTATHEGVTVTYSNTKTIYFQNNWNWTELKLHYWYENGEDRWTTVADGLLVDDMESEKVGGYDLYTFEIPAYVAGFKIEGYDSTTTTTHSTEEVSAENIIDGNVYWFVYGNGEYAISSNKYEPNFKTHDIYVVGSMNDWSTENIDSKYHLTPSSDGTKWTGSITFDVTTQIKMYNTMIISDGYGGWINGEGTTDNVELAPGTYSFEYSVDKNTFTFTMTERKIYLKPSGWESGARFAVYVWNGGDNTWYSMKKEADGTYSCFVPVKYTNIIFGRMNNSQTANNWNNVWNQSVDQTIPTNGNNLWTVTTPYGDNNKSYGSWSRKADQFNKIPSPVRLHGGFFANCYDANFRWQYI